MVLGDPCEKVILHPSPKRATTHRMRTDLKRKKTKIQYACSKYKLIKLKIAGFIKIFILQKITKKIKKVSDKEDKTSKI